MLVLIVLGGLCFYSANIAEAAKAMEVATNTDLDPNNSQAPAPANFAGMDEAVNEKLAEAAGRPARAPYIDTESMGDLWNLLLLTAGGICGFVVGRWWHLLWGNRQ